MWFLKQASCYLNHSTRMYVFLFFWSVAVQMGIASKCLCTPSCSVGGSFFWGGAQVPLSGFH